jgi:hypothetical protein
MNAKEITLLWACVAMLAIIPVAGAICAICDHNISMFYVSLIALPVCAIIFPIAAILINVCPLLLVFLISSIVLKIRKLLFRR